MLNTEQMEDFNNNNSTFETFGATMVAESFTSNTVTTIFTKTNGKASVSQEKCEIVMDGDTIAKSITSSKFILTKFKDVETHTSREFIRFVQSNNSYLNITYPEPEEEEE